MTALLYLIVICAFALVACLLAGFWERDAERPVTPAEWEAAAERVVLGMKRGQR